MTAGIVSARGRDIGSGPYDDFLQIDAPVNHGNSGGPTFNDRRPGGRRQHGDLLAVGRQRRHRLRDRERRRQERRPAAEGERLGHARLARRRDPAGDAGHRRRPRPQERLRARWSPRRKRIRRPPTAGVKSGDVITAVNGETVADPHELARKIAALGPKKTATLDVIRDGAPKTIDVTLGTMPADKTANAETGGSTGNAENSSSALPSSG